MVRWPGLPLVGLAAGVTARDVHETSFMSSEACLESRVIGLVSRLQSIFTHINNAAARHIDDGTGTDAANFSHTTKLLVTSRPRSKVQSQAWVSAI